MASCKPVLKSGLKSKLRQVSNSAQTQHFSSLELLLDSYMPEMALSSKLKRSVVDLSMNIQAYSNLHGLNHESTG